MNSKPLIIEALETIGPCDIETLASHMDQSQNIVSSMLVKFMRVNAVKVSNGMYCLSGELQAKEEAPAAAIQDSSAPTGEEIATSASASAPEKTPLPEFKPGKVSALSASKRLINALESAGNEVSAVELATMAGIPGKSISAVLHSSVNQGKVLLRKEGRRTFYSLPDAAVQTQTITVLGIKTAITAPPVKEDIPPLNIDGPNLDHHDEITTGTQAADQPVYEVPAPPAPKFITSITVPTSAVIILELEKLDDELSEAQQRFERLKAERTRKGQLLILVGKLERNLNGEIIYG